jgi:hypothetical protein
VQRKGDDLMFLDAANYQRYDAYVALAEELSITQAVEAYVRYYPLFQQAYEELGYSDRYFNDRFVEVIDHLLQTPAADEPIALLRPKVYYTFADPDLEALSAGQKVLLRIGPQHASAIKIKLRELRGALVSLEPTKQR